MKERVKSSKKHRPQIICTLLSKLENNLNKYFLSFSIVSEKSLVIGQIKAQRGFVYCLFKLIQFGLGTRLTKRLNLSTK